jgi:hypothetical protein
VEKLKLATRSRAAEPGAGAKTRLTKNDGIDAEARSRCIRTVYPYRVSVPCIRTVYPYLGRGRETFAQRSPLSLPTGGLRRAG